MSGTEAMLVVMGVSGVGKTTLGEALAKRLGWAFIDGDALHPQANIDKMSAGIPLTDADRGPWLDAVAAWIDARHAEGRPGVVTCSALKRAYRDLLDDGRPQVRFVYIQLDQADVADRMAHRKGHFFAPSLLASQFADLEEPAADEPVIVVDGAKPIPAQLDAVVARVRASG